MHRNTEIVVAAAERLGLHIEPVTYPDGTRTAEDAARAIGVDVAQIVKSLVFDLVPADGPHKGKTLKGIFVIEKGDLKLCLGKEGEEPLTR